MAFDDPGAPLHDLVAGAIERGERAQDHSRALIADLRTARSTLCSTLVDVRARQARFRVTRAAAPPARREPGSRGGGA